MNYIIIVTDCDCIVSFYSFHDELTSSWHINILSDNLEVTESITAKPVDLIECLNA